MRIFEPQTPRLKLRQWNIVDREPFAKMNADREVMRYYPAVLTESESYAMIDKLQSLIAARGWGFWAVERTSDTAFIGFVGLHEPDYELPVKPCVEIGWRLAREYWGQGYATEAANAALSVAFKQLNLPQVYSFTSTNNVNSQRVMQRIGMRDMQRNFDHPMIPQGHALSEHVLYRIDREQWDTLNMKNMIGSHARIRRAGE